MVLEMVAALGYLVPESLAVPVVVVAAAVAVVAVADVAVSMMLVHCDHC